MSLSKTYFLNILNHVIVIVYQYLKEIE